MSRSTQWRRVVSDACNWHQSQALEATIYLLRQTGPTGFLLKEEGETRTVKVYLGDPHTCTCAVYKKERDLCKHICWLLLRKFRLSQNDPLSWQLGLVEREVNEILQGRNTAPRESQARQNKSKPNAEESVDGRTVVQQREIAEDDVCPICQDELLSKKLPVTYCRFGCGNTIHIKCMSVWAEHQQKTSQDKSIKCPMCREDFGSIEALKSESRNAGVQRNNPQGIRLDRHSGIACSHCSKAPIEGKCYRCVVCSHFHLCQRCFNLPVHTDHAFQFRQKRNQRWRAATRTLGASLPPALVQDLMNRDISEDDYDSLLLLDRNSEGDLSTLTEEALHRLPMERVRERSQLLSHGAQCRVCLRGFLLGQYVRRLPCQHKFHKDCIDNWLLHSHPTCPIDGLVALRNEDQQHRNGPHSASQSSGTPETSASGLTINAMGIPMASSRIYQSGDGSNPSLRRPPPIPLNPQPTTPQGLELTGTGLAGGDDDSVNHHWPSGEGREYVPGERLLRQSRLHRQRIAQQLTNTNRGNSSNRNQRTMTLGDLVQCQPSSSDFTPVDSTDTILGERIISRHNSAGSLGGAERAPLSGGRRNSRGRPRPLPSNGSLRNRSSSLERIIPSLQAATQTIRDLYLGNDPSLQPPVNGDATSISIPAKQSERTFRANRFPPGISANRTQSLLSSPAVTGVARNTREIRLEGFAIDNITD